MARSVPARRARAPAANSSAPAGNSAAPAVSAAFDEHDASTWLTLPQETLAPQPGEPVLGNFMFGIFSNNTGGDLKQVLADLGADTLVLCGVATGMAVMTAVIQCADMFYKVIVPSDASIDANQALHDIAMNNVIPAMALVTTSAMPGALISGFRS